MVLLIMEFYEYISISIYTISIFLTGLLIGLKLNSNVSLPVPSLPSLPIVSGGPEKSRGQVFNEVKEEVDLTPDVAANPDLLFKRD